MNFSLTENNDNTGVVVSVRNNIICQYVFVSIYRAFVESIASENAARLSSMQAAEKNIEERLEELNAFYRHQCQS